MTKQKPPRAQIVSITLDLESESILERLAASIPAGERSGVNRTGKPGMKSEAVRRALRHYAEHVL